MSSNLGQLGEDVASAYLVENGFKILERNFRRPWGEIDIVAQYKDGTLVFVECKTMNTVNSQSLLPEDQLTQTKLLKLQRTAALYSGGHPELVHDPHGWRIDLLCLTVKKTPPQTAGDFEIKHYENI